MRFSSPCYNLASPADGRQHLVQSCHVFGSCLRAMSSGHVFADRMPARKPGYAGMQVAPPPVHPYVLPLNPAPRRPIPMTNLSTRLRLVSTTLGVAAILGAGF